MVLLAAVVLLLGFAALTVLDVRLSRVPGDLDPSRRAEFDPRGLEAGLSNLAWRLNATHNVTTAPFDAAMDDALEQVEDLSRQQGKPMRVTWSKTCVQVGADQDQVVSYSVTWTDGETLLSVPLSTTIRIPQTPC